VTFSNSNSGSCSFRYVRNFGVNVLRFTDSSFSIVFTSFDDTPVVLAFLIASYRAIMFCCSLVVFSSFCLVFSILTLCTALAMLSALSNSDLDSVVRSVRSVLIISSILMPRLTGITMNRVFMMRIFYEHLCLLWRF